MLTSARRVRRVGRPRRRNSFGRAYLPEIPNIGVRISRHGREALPRHLLCFFFSSRRRHTRCSRDWSSDVCSSDLYQRDEVIKFADFRGDSLKLSFQAWETYSRYIVFCGVHFMAESADILRREHQIVMLPDLHAGCSLADMADIRQVEACWSDLASVGNPSNVVPVSYMNTTAAIKAFTGGHCRSD